MKSSKAKTVIGVIAVVLVVLLLVGGLAALSSGFKDWDVTNWISPKYVSDETVYNYFNENGVVTLSNLQPGCRDKYVLLPSRIDGIDVTEMIGTFHQNEYIVGVKIPNGYKKIYGQAFVECPNLRKVYIPASVTEIASGVFAGSNDVTVYCEAAEAPSGWASDWTFTGETNVKVVWGYRA